MDSSDAVLDAVLSQIEAADVTEEEQSVATNHSQSTAVPEANASQSTVAPEADASQSTVTPEANASQPSAVPEADALQSTVTPEADASQPSAVPIASQVVQPVVDQSPRSTAFVEPLSLPKSSSRRARRGISESSENSGTPSNRTRKRVLSGAPSASLTRSNSTKFAVDDKVDVLSHGTWWNGTITALLKVQPGITQYSVTFSNLPKAYDELCEENQLRAEVQKRQFGAMAKRVTNKKLDNLRIDEQSVLIVGSVESLRVLEVDPYNGTLLVWDPVEPNGRIVQYENVLKVVVEPTTTECLKQPPAKRAKRVDDKPKTSNTKPPKKLTSAAGAAHKQPNASKATKDKAVSSSTVTTVHSLLQTSPKQPSMSPKRQPLPTQPLPLEIRASPSEHQVEADGDVDDASNSGALSVVSPSSPPLPPCPKPRIPKVPSFLSQMDGRSQSPFGVLRQEFLLKCREPQRVAFQLGSTTHGESVQGGHFLSAQRPHQDLRLQPLCRCRAAPSEGDAQFAQH